MLLRFIGTFHPFQTSLARSLGVDRGGDMGRPRRGIEKPAGKGGAKLEMRRRSSSTRDNVTGGRWIAVNRVFPRGYMTKCADSLRASGGSPKRLGDAQAASSSISRVLCAPRRLSRCSRARFVRAQRVAHSGDARLPRAAVLQRRDSDRHGVQGHQPLCQRQGLPARRGSRERSDPSPR